MNKVILIGEDHHNILGMVRAFGIEGINPFGLLIGCDRTSSFVGVSKYWNKVYFLENTKKIIDFLVENFCDETEKPVIICCSDPAVDVIDLNVNKLSKKYIMTSINETEGQLHQYMNKQKQSELFERLNIKKLPTLTISPMNYSNINCEYPIILKPAASIDGKKSDIRVCRDSTGLNEAILELRDKRYNRVLVQPYLETRIEYVIVGAINRKLLSYTLLKNIRQWPIDSGTGTYSEFVKDSKIHGYARSVLRKIIEFGYSGPIDIEFFVDKNEKFYINEINWRSSGRNFVSNFTGVNSTYLWYKSVTNSDYQYVEDIYKNLGTVMTESTDIKNVFAKNVSLRSWIREYKECNSYAVHDRDDIKPEIKRITKLIYSKLGGLNKK